MRRVFVCVCCVCVCVVFVFLSAVILLTSAGNQETELQGGIRLLLDGCVCSCRLHIFECAAVIICTSVCVSVSYNGCMFCVHLKQEVSDVHVEHGSVRVKLLIVSVG